MMLQKRKILFLAIVLNCVATSAQLFRPLDLGFSGGDFLGEYSQPRMHVEGDRLYVCTSRGLYCKDLADDSSAWQLAGFEGIPLQDYARRGSDILALRYNKGSGFLLLSHDGGQTFEDVTPDFLSHEKYEILPSLAQHPTDPNTLLVSSIYWGIFCSTDFGQKWENLTEWLYGNPVASFIGFHPARPSIIYNSGEGGYFNGHIAISYDDGNTWIHRDTWGSGDEWLGFGGDNCVHRPTFHPTNPDRWLAGGEGCVFLSDDNGQTWNCQNYWGDVSRDAYWFFSAFDNEHPDTVYLAGCTNAPMEKAYIMLMCSTDGGRSWYPSQLMAAKKDNENVCDMQQYKDRLFIYTESDVYEVSKEKLVTRSTSVNPYVLDMPSEDAPTYDLHGRPVATSQQGISIKNGKKIVRKSGI